MLCAPADRTAADPDPDETTKRGVELVRDWDGTPAGIVGWLEGGWSAVELASRHAGSVDRLVLVSTPPLEGVEPRPVNAKTLLLFGSRDGGQRQATWWKERLGGRIEMVPGAGTDILELVWPRVLSHLAPGALRK